jgi:hypothetical protein
VPKSLFRAAIVGVAVFSVTWCGAIAWILQLAPEGAAHPLLTAAVLAGLTAIPVAGVASALVFVFSQFPRASVAGLLFAVLTSAVCAAICVVVPVSEGKPIEWPVVATAVAFTLPIAFASSLWAAGIMGFVRLMWAGVSGRKPA